MDEFKKWLIESYDLLKSGIVIKHPYQQDLEDCWQESAKQERKQIVDDIRKMRANPNDIPILKVTMAESVGNLSLFALIKNYIADRIEANNR